MLKMPTIVVIVTFISMINTTFESLKERKGFILQHFSFMSNEFVLIVVVHGKSFITLVPDFALSLQAPRQTCHSKSYSTKYAVSSRGNQTCGHRGLCEILLYVVKKIELPCGVAPMKGRQIFLVFMYTHSST